MPRQCNPIHPPLFFLVKIYPHTHARRRTLARFALADVDRCGSDDLAEAAGAGGPGGEPGGCGDLRRDLYPWVGVGAADAQEAGWLREAGLLKLG